MNATATPYVAQLATARKTAQDAAEALATAHKSIQPPTPELHALFITRPEAYAKALHQMADIVANLPALTEAATAAYAALAPLEAKACYRCLGTGEYGGASNHTRRGHKYCFHCNGRGTTAA